MYSNSYLEFEVGAGQQLVPPWLFLSSVQY